MARKRGTNSAVRSYERRTKAMKSVYLRGLLAGGLLGAAYLAYVYWRAQLFPGNPQLKQYYAWLRALGEKPA